MTLSISRWFRWVVVLLILAGAFAYYAHHHPEWKTSLHQTMRAFYLAP